MNKVWTKEEAFVFRLKKGMKDNNMTVTDLAEATGISTRGIRFWISEIRCCKESFLPRIASALGVSVYDMTQPPSDAELQELNK
jgi:DNA-binding Xre family transcriptional regulator